MTIEASTQGPAPFQGLEHRLTNMILDQCQLDTTERAQLDPELQDNLTGLPNLYAFRERMSADIDHINQANESGLYGPFAPSLSVILIDLDDFTRFNAMRGQEIGDRVLQAFADALRFNMRQDDFLARIGEDEFGIVAPAAGAWGARALAERAIEAACDASAVVDLPRFAVSASVGFSLHPFHGTNAEELLESAEGALNRVKSGGKNNIAAGVPAEAA